MIGQLNQRRFDLITVADLTTTLNSVVNGPDIPLPADYEDLCIWIALTGTFTNVSLTVGFNPTFDDANFWSPITPDTGLTYTAAALVRLYSVVPAARLRLNVNMTAGSTITAKTRVLRRLAGNY